MIPSLSFSNEESHEYCFEGIPEESVLWINTIGPLRDIEARPLFWSGLDAAIERLSPTFLYVRTGSTAYREMLEDRLKGRVEHEFIKNDNWLYGA